MINRYRHSADVSNADQESPSVTPSVSSSFDA